MTTLPELEGLLLRAAHARTARRHAWQRRAGAAGAFLALALTGGAVATATGVLHLADGTTPEGITYTIDRQDGPGVVCLQLEFRDGGAPAYGCGSRPTAKDPFGVVIVDSLNVAGHRVVYGLVTADIARVSVLGKGDAHTDGATVAKPSLPGRFFSITAPRGSRVELVGYDRAGHERARIGSRRRPDHPARTREEARAQGDLSGFAPTVAAPDTFTYRNRPITPDAAAKRGLACEQDRHGVRCFDTEAELEAAERP
jgi:hypothetical protein